MSDGNVREVRPPLTQAQCRAWSRHFIEHNSTHDDNCRLCRDRKLGFWQFMEVYGDTEARGI